MPWVRVRACICLCMCMCVCAYKCVSIFAQVNEPQVYCCGKMGSRDSPARLTCFKDNPYITVKINSHFQPNQLNNIIHAGLYTTGILQATPGTENDKATLIQSNNVTPSKQLKACAPLSETVSNILPTTAGKDKRKGGRRKKRSTQCSRSLCERTWSELASWTLHSAIVKKRNRWSTTSSRTVPSGGNRDTSYGRRMSQPPTSCGERWKTCPAPPSSWWHVDWGSKHGWSTAEEEEVHAPSPFCHRLTLLSDSNSTVNMFHSLTQ